MSMVRHTWRTARKRHVCENCRRVILPGERYVEHVCSPGYIDNDVWWRLAGCGETTDACVRVEERP